jgi:ABC-type glycerol-3-phosphate transport system substrate-binding protein
MKFDYACLRKVSAILLAVVLLFGLAACKTKAPATADPTPDASPTDTPVTTEEPTPEPTPTEPPPDLGGRTIKVGAWWKVFPPAENYEYYAECMELLESVQEKYNCVLESVVYQGGLDAFAAAIKTQISSGSLEYDAFLLHGWWFMPNGAIAGAVAPLDDYLDFSDPRMDHALAEANVYQGKHYAYALYAPGFQGCIFFNKKLLADNGVEAQELYDLVDSGQWTFDKLREYALLCTKDTGDPATSIYGVGFYGWFYCANSFIYANNSSIVTGQAYIAGPYHPAFGEMTDSRIYLFWMEDAIQSVIGDTLKSVTFYLKPTELSKALGQKRSVLNSLLGKYPGLSISILGDKELDRHQMRIELRGGETSCGGCKGSSLGRDHAVKGIINKNGALGTTRVLFINRHDFIEKAARLLMTQYMNEVLTFAAEEDRDLRL